ncbi:MAG: D-tyrosyl-tRNA(Tyr) deacylase [Nitrospirae bacterium]|nr:D-tyrosyl-tRNA(Tyr) deacylase [Nitrospirota bacterium]
MKAVIQRVIEAQVSVDGEVVGRIGPGLVVLLGVAKDDTAEDSDHLADRILGFRIFDDEAGKMNRSVQEIGGQILAVSQFTLIAMVVKGRRPSFESVAGREPAQRLYHRFVDRLIASGLTIETGRFGEQMIVSLHNDGPVTFIMES